MVSAEGAVQWIVVAILACLLLAVPGTAAAFGRAPEEFTGADAGRLEELRSRLRPYRERLLAPGASQEEVQAVLAEAGPLAAQLSALESKRWSWQCHLEGRSPGTGRLDQPPELRTFDPPGGSLDREVLFGLFRDFMNLDTRRTNRGDGAPAAAEWEALASLLLPFAERRMEFDPSGDDPYVLRARLLHGSCELHASAAHFHAGDRDAQHRAFVAGLSTLESLLSAFRAARAGHQSGVDQCERLFTPQPPHTGLEYAGVGSRGLAGHLLSTGQAATSERARDLLVEYCPWGLAAYRALYRAGLTRNLDWRILHAYARGEIQYVSVATASQGVPEKVREAMNRAVEGSVFHYGKSLFIDWEHRPAAPTYTVWFTSPAVSEIRVSKLVGWGLKAIKLYLGGPLDVIVDETIGHLVDQVEKEYGSDSEVYVGAKLAMDLNNYGLESDFLIDGKSFKQGKPPKEILMGLLKWLEQRTIELTFEGIDPENSSLRAQIGNPSSYDGSPVPPVLLRGDVLGFERVPAERYRHTWNVLSFHQLDLRSIGGGTKYDLGRGSLRSAGRDLTWVKLDDPFGSRLMLADMTPQIQVIRLEERGELVKGWQEALKEGQTLAALLYRRAGDAKPVAFHEIGDREVSFRIQNLDQLARDGTVSNIFWPEEAKASWSTQAPRCDYTIKVAAVRKTEAYTHAGEVGWSPDIFWADPVKIFATRPARFLDKGGKKSTGVATYPTKGCAVLTLPPTARRPTPTPAPAGPGRLSGRIDPDWFEGWKRTNFRYGPETGKQDFLEAKPISFTADDRGRWSFSPCEYVIQHSTLEGGQPVAYRSTMASVRHTLVVSGVEGDWIHGSYTSEASAKSHVFVPTLFGTRDRKQLQGLSGDGRWHAERLADGSWRLVLEPGRADLPQMKVPLVFTLRSPE